MKLTNDYKRRVYQMMDSVGVSRDEASEFGNLRSSNTWKSIEDYCNYNKLVKVITIKQWLEMREKSQEVVPPKHNKIGSVPIDTTQIDADKQVEEFAPRILTMEEFENLLEYSTNHKSQAQAQSEDLDDPEEDDEDDTNIQEKTSLRKKIRIGGKTKAHLIIAAIFIWLTLTSTSLVIGYRLFSNGAVLRPTEASEQSQQIK